MTPEERVKEAWDLAKQVYPSKERGGRRAHERFKNAFIEEAARKWELPMGDVRRIVERRKR